MNADVGVLLAIYGERAGHINIGAVEVLQFCFPVLPFKIKEECAERVWIVKRFFGDSLHLVGANVRAGLAWFHCPRPEPHLAHARPAETLVLSAT